jgi:hypothetical protein
MLSPERSPMSDDPLRPPLDYEGMPPSDDGTTVVGKASESVKRAAESVSAAYDRARKPGMPLSVLSNIAREAPLGSLLVAFLLGVAFARRR